MMKQSHNTNQNLSKEERSDSFKLSTTQQITLFVVAIFVKGILKVVSNNIGTDFQGVLVAFNIAVSAIILFDGFYMIINSLHKIKENLDKDETNK